MDFGLVGVVRVNDLPRECHVIIFGLLYRPEFSTFFFVAMVFAATDVWQASKVFDADGDQLGIGSVSKRFGAVEGHELVHLVLAQDLVVQHVVAYLLESREQKGDV